MNVEIKGGNFKSLKIEPVTIGPNSIYFITTPENELQDFIYTSAQTTNEIQFLNAPSNLYADLKVGEVYNGGRLNFQLYGALVSHYGINDKPRSSLVVAFKILIMKAFLNHDLVVMTSDGLSTESIVEIVFFIKDIVTSRSKSAIIIHNSTTESSLPYSIKKIDLANLKNFIKDLH